MTELTIQGTLELTPKGGRSRARRGDESRTMNQDNQPGRTPKIARMMALAIRLDDLVQQGVVRDYADIARLGHVSRPRVTQIMNLLMLAPDLQERILDLPQITEGKDTIQQRNIRKIASVPDWGKQRKMWDEMDSLTT